jgi:hypothetical protein
MKILDAAQFRSKIFYMTTTESIGTLEVNRLDETAFYQLDSEGWARREQQRAARLAQIAGRLGLDTAPPAIVEQFNTQVWPDGTVAMTRRDYLAIAGQDQIGVEVPEPTARYYGSF